MIIKVARHAGFCFGVRSAVNTVYDLLNAAPKRKIYTLGKLIHNRLLIEALEEKGVTVLENDRIEAAFAAADASHPASIVIRAHGIPKDLQAQLEALCAQNPHVELVDRTCPNVKTIHQTVEKYATADRHLIIFGNPEHPEVLGIRSYAAGKVTVCPDLATLQAQNLCGKSIVMVAQTTQNLAEWRKCQQFIENLCTNALIFDTICKVTEQRQNETAVLAKEVDCMMVIGGHDSSNTKKLYEIAKAIQPNTYFLESPADLPVGAVKPQNTVGMTAGASTPDGMIEEVKTMMNEQTNNITAEDFAELLNESFKILHKGETVTGTVVSITGNGVIVDIGTKSTGIVPAAELSAGDLETLKAGDEITVRVVQLNDQEGQTTLSKKAVDRDAHWTAVVTAKENDETLCGKVTKAVKGGILMNINGTELFVPASQTGLEKDADLETLVGTEQSVKIIDIDEKKHRAVASIRVVQRAERRARKEAFWDTVAEGMQFTGVVKSLTSYGAFVDLGGLDGMIHVSELSWKRIKHPSAVLSVGDTVTVFVKSFDREKDRVSLGYKTEETNPWNIFMNTYKLDDTAAVKIVSLTAYGAFAEVVPGVDGLIHISQIANRKIAEPAEVLSVGDTVDAKIIEIDEENHKISLSIRALLAETSADAADAADAADESTEA